jgi:hypothetical protein
MKEVKPITRMLVLLTLALMIGACGKATSKSSNGQYSPEPKDDKPIENNLDPIALDSENYTQIASQSLKSLLLNDAGSTALNQAVTVTSGQGSQIADMVSGIVLTLAPYPCMQGGSLAMRAVITSTNNNVQLDLNNPLRLSFDADFNECKQYGSSLDGDVSLVLNAQLSQLINNPMYSMASHLDVQGLSVEQLNMPSFVFDGTFDYTMASSDGISVTTGIASNNSVYFADQSYQIFEFDLQKTVNNASQAYSYSISSEFTDSVNPNAYVAYETQLPLTGTGFSPPTGGRIAVHGSNGVVLIHALANQHILLQLDLGNDGVFDNQYYTTWEDLVFESFGVTTN